MELFMKSGKIFNNSASAGETFFSGRPLIRNTAISKDNNIYQEMRNVANDTAFFVESDNRYYEFENVKKYPLYLRMRIILGLTFASWLMLLLLAKLLYSII